jgi:hypothetical protein
MKSGCWSHARRAWSVARTGRTKQPIDGATANRHEHGMSMSARIVVIRRRRRSMTGGDDLRMG